MSFVIAVKIGSLPHGYEPILNYYNTNRDPNTPPLEKLPRCEGGFMIKFPNFEEIKDYEINNKIQQLRWSKRQLVSDIYYGFHDDQLELLYEALCSSLGQSNVDKIEQNQANTLQRTFYVKKI